MANPTQHRLGQYEIDRLIGRGGMAVVYRARQASMDREVAIKIIKTDLAADAKFVERFRQEARLVASLSHPHILKVFDYGQQGQVLYLVMELLKGGSLAAFIQKGPLPVNLALNVLNQIASALQYAHQKGLIHRDLKPENVLFDETGNAFLSDFGLAKLLGSQSLQTQTGAIMGTPAYMAPEQWRGSNVDLRADIYALGILTFEMLTGALPFDVDTPFAFMHMHINELPPSIVERNAALPPSLEPVIRKVLAKDPTERFQSAGAFVGAFTQAVAGSESGARIDVASGLNDIGWAAVSSSAAQAAHPWQVWLTSPWSYLVGGVAVLAVLVFLLVGVFAARQNNQPVMIPSVASIPTEVLAIESPTSAPVPTDTPTMTSTIPLPLPMLTKTSRPARFTPTLRNTATDIAPTEPPSLTPTLINLPGKIAFGAQPDSTSQHGIYVIRPNGTGLTLLIGAPGLTTDATWSRNGKYIAFSSNRRNSNGFEIFIANADGSNLHSLMSQPVAGIDSEPAWSPDGSQIAFTSDRVEAWSQFDIFVVNIDGTHLRQLTKPEKGSRQHADSPTWSSDGKSIAFAIEQDGSSDIYVMDSSGGNLHPLTNNAVQDTYPRWSPDGKQIAFNSNRGGKYGIYVMNPDGSQVRQIAQEGGYATWSPDSQHLAFSAGATHGNVYIIGLDGSAPQLLWYDRYAHINSASPSWGP